MADKEIDRSEFRHNFLKSIIIRLDFQGVLEAEMEKVLVHVKHFAKEQGFSRYAEENDIEVISESVETKNKFRRQRVYSFINEDRGFALHVSAVFVCLVINSARYIPFEAYCDIVPRISDIYRKNIDFFTVTRWGIRKINECLISDKTKIKDYFNPVYFSCYDQIENVNSLQSNHINIFTYNKYHINLLTNVIQGKLKDKAVYSVRIDIDAHLDAAEKILRLLNESAEQFAVNNLLFRIYVSLLTPEFITLLTSDDDFDSDVLLGVERND